MPYIRLGKEIIFLRKDDLLPTFIFHFYQFYLKYSAILMIKRKYNCIVSFFSKSTRILLALQVAIEFNGYFTIKITIEIHIIPYLPEEFTVNLQKTSNSV